MTPRLWISQLTFKDGTDIALDSNDVVVVVGPNNAGKSAILRAIRDRLQANNDTPVVGKIESRREGTTEDVADWLSTFTKTPDPTASDLSFQAFGKGMPKSNIPSRWSNQNSLHELTRFFCHLLTADERLSAANAAPGIAILRDPPTHPIHFLLRDDALEKRLSDQFFRAFGVDMLLDRAAGNQIPLRVGIRPIPEIGEDRLSLAYLEKLDALPLLQGQGDGMRSFAGVLLNMSIGHESILLVDEPEAFLHPPQARQLGKMMVVDKSDKRQLFVATHSGDVLRGILDAGRPSVRVIRVRRVGNVNHLRQLENSRVAELWGDPLLRYSNILDGLFHEKVVVCEGDADARFYSAVADTLFDGPDTRKPDVMFTHCGGKDRLAMVVRALTEVDVPVAVAVDFDVLSAERPLRDLVEIMGGEWSSIGSFWKTVKSSIDAKKPDLTPDEIRVEIARTLEGVSDAASLKAAKETVQKLFRRSTPWEVAKTTGKAFVPPGQPTQAFTRLMSELRRLGIFVVEEGEVENFVRSVGNHGPKWVNETLKLNLASDPELTAARAYVAMLVADAG